MLRCPDDLELERLLDGSSTAAEGLRLELHLATCATCRAWIEEARRDDALVPHLLRAVAVEPADPRQARVAATAQHVPQHYRIVRRLGAGGMGVVFEAEQLQPPRRVALKVLSGSPSARAILRFEVEAEALARLDHEGIARIFEAGTFESLDGPLPFFAMELIEGRPMDRHLREQEPGLRARLELFHAIASAVAHAHLKGVVHRDLKPANVLVTPEGKPKVVDFGVARLSRANGGIDERATRAGELVGTLAYMSPEQIAGDPAQVDTRSDVYGLGVLLYEMLTGVLPYDLGGKGLAGAASTIADVAPLPPRWHGRLLHRDLQTILLQALHKSPAQRYGSAAELAADLQRHLRHEPITARATGPCERLAKYLMRNQAFVAGSLAVFLALAAGLVTTTGQARRARKAEGDALRQAQRSRSAVEYLRRLLWGPEAGAVERPAGYTLRAALDEAATLLAGTRGLDPELEAELHVTLGNAYTTLALHPSALQHLERALELRRERFGERHVATAETRNSLAVLRSAMGQPGRSVRLLEEVLEVYARELAPDDPRVAVAEVNLAVARIEIGQEAQAEEELRAAMESMDGALQEPTVQRALARSTLAQLYAGRDETQAASVLAEQALAEYEAILGRGHARTLLVRIALEKLHAVRELDAAALARLQGACEELEEYAGADHPFLAKGLAALAEAWLAHGGLAQAEAAAVRALALWRARLPGHADVARTHELLARILAAAGDRAGEARELGHAVDLCRGLEEPTATCAAELELRLARALLALGRWEAAHVRLTALAQRSDLGPLARTIHVQRINLATRLMDLGLLAEAQSHVDAALDALEADPEANPGWLQSARNNRAALLRLRGDREGARAILEGLLEQRMSEKDASGLSLAATRNNLGRVLGELGQHARAEELVREALAAWSEAHGMAHETTLAAQRNLATVLTATGRPAAARELLETALVAARAAPESRPRRLGELLQAYGECLLALDERAAAAAALREGREQLTSELPEDHPSVLALEQMLAECRR